MTASTDRAALAMVAVATFGLSIKGIFAKLAYATGMAVDLVVLLRLVMALPVIYLAVWAMGHDMLALTRRDWRDAMAVGGLFLIATVADFTAISLIGAGLSRIVLFTFPLIVVLIGALRERTPPKPKHLLAFFVAYGGLTVIIDPLRDGLAPDFWTGIGWAMVSAVAYALYLSFGQGVIRRIGSARFTAAANTGAALGIVLYAPLVLESGAWESLTWSGMGWMTAIVLFSTVMPFFLLYEGIGRLGAGRASLLSLIGPAMTVSIAWVVLGETLNTLQMAGFALVLIGIAVLEGKLKRAPRPPVAAQAPESGRVRS